MSRRSAFGPAMAFIANLYDRNILYCDAINCKIPFSDQAHPLIENSHKRPLSLPLPPSRCYNEPIPASKEGPILECIWTGKPEFYGGAFGRIVPILTALLFIAAAAVSESDVNGYSIAFFAAVAAGCLFARDRSAYGEAAIAGLARPMFGTVAVAILFAAVGGKLVAGSGLIDSLAFLLVKARVSGAAFCAVSFLLCCLLSMSTGTSVGTYVVSIPLLFPVGILVGSDPLFLIGALVSGGLFGDNLAPVSDTTIASATTQGANMGDVVKSRCYYSLPVAAACFLVFLFLGGSRDRSFVSPDLVFRPVSLAMLAVPAVVIVLCLRKMHLIAALSWGIAAGIFIGLAAGLYRPADLLSYPGGFRVEGLICSAITGTASTIFMLIGAFLFLGVVEAGGLIDLLADAISRLSRGRRSAEFIIALSVGALGAITGVCTVSMIALGDIVGEIGKRYGVPRCRRSNLMDCGGLCLTSLAPWTVHAVYPVTLAAGVVPDLILSPVQVVTHNFYGIFMVLLILFAILTGYGYREEKAEEKADPGR